MKEVRELTILICGEPHAEQKEWQVPRLVKGVMSDMFADQQGVQRGWISEKEGKEMT